MNRITSTDWLVFILVAVFLVDLDFDNMNLLNWVGFGVSMLWLVIFVFKQLTKKRG